jgi:hypothetical protein
MLNYTIWASRHRIAPLLCGGQMWKTGRSVFSGGICWRAVRSIMAIRARVQAQMSARSLHSFMRCRRLSVLLQSGHLYVSRRGIRAILAFVGIRTCITWNHVDCKSTGVQTSCRFSQTVSHGSVGCMVIILTPLSLYNCVLLHLQTSEFEKTRPWFKFFTKKIIQESYNKKNCWSSRYKWKIMDKENFVMFHILSCNNKLSVLMILIHIMGKIQSLPPRDAVASLL